MLLAAVVIFLIQLFLFRTSIFPSTSAVILIKGQSCTCPHAKTIRGEEQLRVITPDSLLKYNLNYSELYFEDEISTPQDLMGVNHYEISGEIIGKRNTFTTDTFQYYPIVKLKSYKETIPLVVSPWFLCILLISGALALFLIIKLIQSSKKRKKSVVF